MVFGGLLLGKPSFSREKRWFSEGWLLKTIFFSRKRWFRTKKLSFSQKNQKTKKKTSFPKLWGWGLQKMVFLLVFLVFSRKRWFFWFETIFFSRKRWFYQEKTSKNHLFLEKMMVSNQKTIFFSRKPKKPKKNKKKPSFPKLWGWGLQKMVFFGLFGFFWFSREKDGFFGSKPSFSREKDGFTRRRPPKTIFFSRKRWFYQEKTSKNHLFLEKKMVSNQKTIFFSRKQKKTSFGGPSPIVLEKMVFLFFLVFWFFVSC